jgi:hypothetical protein
MVDRSVLFSREMVWITSSWWEEFSNAIGKASRRFILHSEPKATEELLSPLQQMISRPPETLLEVAFLAQFGGEIAAAGESIRAFLAAGEILHIHSVWTRLV